MLAKKLAAMRVVKLVGLMAEWKAHCWADLSVGKQVGWWEQLMVASKVDRWADWLADLKDVTTEHRMVVHSVESMVEWTAKCSA